MIFSGKGFCKQALQLIFVFSGMKISAQTADSMQLQEVVVHSYFHDRPWLRIPSAVAVIDSSILSSQSGQSIVNGINTAAGVRMEERSPGSYRLSIRGSLLRSPFGVRNIKVYLDEFPLTDAGGNTYINLIDPALIPRIEVLKGPDGSLFGANSGGVVRLDMLSRTNQGSFAEGGINAGSYGLWHQFATVQYQRKNNVVSVSDGLQHCDGYRANSRMDRQYFQVADRLNYSARSELRLLCFYSEIWYRTPGALTLSEYNADPSAARPATAKLPGAEEQHAGVHNQTFYGGLLHETKVGRQSRLVTLLFGSHTDFENPFITNFEVRDELSGGVRAWFETTREHGNSKWKWNTGIEGQRTNSQITNYDNKRGDRDTLRADSFLEASQLFAFTDLSLDFANMIQTDMSLSYDLNSYHYRNNLSGAPFQRRNFVPQLMPRISMSWIRARKFVIRGTVSKGYSSPALAEILSSGNILNAELQPEYGWNYEAGLRFHDLQNRLWLDLAGFYYKLDHAIVRRVDDAGNEYFINSGGTEQPGFEAQLNLDLVRHRETRILRQLSLRESYTLSPFRFRQYSIEGNDYSGNHLTGVPGQVLVSAVTVELPFSFSLFIQHSYVSSLFLNDANTESASPCNLLMAKLTWRIHFFGATIAANAGVDNILDMRYSLGNDLNAAGSRYYNAAAPRNIFAGLTVMYR